MELAVSTVNWKIDNDSTLLFFAFGALCSGLSSWIPTASAVRYYTAIQSYFDWRVSLYLVSDLAVPLVEAVLWRVSKLATSTLTRLVVCLRSSRFVNLRSLVEQFGCSLIRSVVWSSGQSIEPAPDFVFTLLKLFVKLLLAIDCEQLAESTGLINIMLVMTSNSDKSY